MKGKEFCEVEIVLPLIRSSLTRAREYEAQLELTEINTFCSDIVHSLLHGTSIMNMLIPKLYSVEQNRLPLRKRQNTSFKIFIA